MYNETRGLVNTTVRWHENMDASHFLVGERIQSISAFGNDPCNVPWLRVTLEGGKKVEITPIEVTLDGERYPSLGIDIEVVEKFAEAHKWPGGPAIDFDEIGKLDSVKEIPIVAVETSDRLDEGIINSILLKFEGGEVVEVTHSSSPMSLDYEKYDSDGTSAT